MRAANPNTFREDCGRFRTQLRTEETLLFPKLKALHPDEVQHFRTTHQEIVDLVDEVAAGSDPTQIQEPAQELLERLRAHAAEEDTAVYAWLDAKLSANDREDVLVCLLRHIELPSRSV